MHECLTESTNSPKWRIIQGSSHNPSAHSPVDLDVKACVAWCRSVCAVILAAIGRRFCRTTGTDTIGSAGSVKSIYHGIFCHRSNARSRPIDSIRLAEGIQVTCWEASGPDRATSQWVLLHEEERKLPIGTHLKVGAFGEVALHDSHILTHIHSYTSKTRPFLVYHR